MQDSTIILKIAKGSDLRRLRHTDDLNFEALKKQIESCFEISCKDYNIKYQDEDSDLITISNDTDIEEAIDQSKKSSTRTLRIFVESKQANANNIDQIQLISPSVSPAQNPFFGGQFLANMFLSQVLRSPQLLMHVAQMINTLQRNKTQSENITEQSSDTTTTPNSNPDELSSLFEGLALNHEKINQQDAQKTLSQQLLSNASFQEMLPSLVNAVDSFSLESKPPAPTSSASYSPIKSSSDPLRIAPYNPKTAAEDLVCDGLFMEDVTVADGYEVECSTAFIKIWALKNNSTTIWPPNVRLTHVSGDRLGTSTPTVVVVQHEVIPGSEIHIPLDLIAPSYPGRYQSFWKLALPDGRLFGPRLWIDVIVTAPKPPEPEKPQDSMADV